MCFFVFFSEEGGESLIEGSDECCGSEKRGSEGGFASALGVHLK